MYDVLNRSPECSLVTSPAAAVLFSRCQPRDMAFPFPKNGVREAEPATQALVRGGRSGLGKDLLGEITRPLALTLYPLTLPVIASQLVPQIQSQPGLGHDSGGPQLNATSIYQAPSVPGILHLQLERCLGGGSGYE